MITPSDEQNKAIQAIADWYKNSDKPFFYLGGYAGSGKTTIARWAVEACGLDPDNKISVKYASFTGKAALIMRRKGLHGASTVHSLIYKLLDDRKELVFVLNRLESPVLNADIVVLDECSMINQEMAKDLLWFEKKVLVLGDPGQLKPIQGEGYFTANDPDFFLQEIHRQALENPIIRFSKDVREGKEIPYGDYNELRKVHPDELHQGDLTSADQILTGKHVTRHALNRALLDHNGFEGINFPLVPGIKVICLRNQKKRNLLNGMIGTTMRNETSSLNLPRRYFIQSVDVPDMNMIFDDLTIYTGPFEDYYRKRSAMEIDNDKNSCRDFSQFDFGYAITTHKAQGSQWDNVILWDDGFGSWDSTERCRWLYTAVTRAAERLTIVG